MTADPRTWPPELQSAAVALAAMLLAWLLHAVLYRGLERLARSSPGILVFDGSLLRHTRRPALLLLPVLALFLVRGLLTRPLPDDAAEVVADALYLLLVLALTWLAVKLVSVAQDLVEQRYDLDAADNLAARRVRTQSAVIQRLAVVLIGGVGLAVMLLRFESFRQIGAGILASAGVAGIIVGFAAQKALGNLLAGFQIAVTQPIRVDDVVVVEGEWGRIEEITLTYVVVRIWDLRRLVLPISHFLEKPFENWTRTSAKILGTVYLHLDHRVPVAAVRHQLERFVAESEHWDGDVVRLHVTDTSERAVELRALMSAADSPKAWELRCEVREKLVAWLQEHHPDSLPRLRLEESRAGGPEAEGGGAGAGGDRAGPPPGESGEAVEAPGRGAGGQPQGEGE